MTSKLIKDIFSKEELINFEVMDLVHNSIENIGGYRLELEDSIYYGDSKLEVVKNLIESKRELITKSIEESDEMETSWRGIRELGFFSTLHPQITKDFG